MTAQRDQELAALIAGHFGISEQETDRLADIGELVGKINAAGLGPSSVRGLVNSEEIRKILGLGTIRSAWATMSRDDAFPAPVVTEKLWKAADVRKYAMKRQSAREGRPGRPPNSARNGAGERPAS